MLLNQSQPSDLTLVSDPVLESQDVIGTDQESIITQDTPQSEDCIGNNVVCSNPSSEVVTPVDGTVPTETANSPSLISTSSSTTHPAAELPLEAASITVQEESQQQVQQPEVLESPLDTAATTVTTDNMENNNAGTVGDASSELPAIATGNIGSEDDSATTAAGENQESASNTEDKSIDNNPDTSADDLGTTRTSGPAPNNDNEENKADDTRSDDSDAGDSADSDEIDNSDDSGDDSINDNQDGIKDGDDNGDNSGS